MENTAKEGVTAKLCAQIVAIDNEAVPSAARQAANTLVLDGLAVAVAGAGQRSIEILAAHLQQQGSRPEASVIGKGFSLATVPAALLNAASMHALDFEPMWKPSNHALSTTLPAVLALAEAQGNSGLDVVCALIKGIEIQGWIRQACGKVEASELVFHQPGMFGPLGAAVAASHLLQLDADELAHALGIAASRCSGLIANIGTMTKATHCGYAAALGLEAALLAKRGFTANKRVFEASQGYRDAFLPSTFDPGKLLNFGPPFRVIKPGFALKAFPCKYQTHYTIVCGLAAHEQVPSPAEVREVKITSPVFPAADRPQPATGLEGMFSLQFTFAAALIDGKVEMKTFTDERLRDPGLQSLLGKITLAMNPAISSEFDGRIVEATIVLNDGRVIRTRCEKPPGSWGAPPIPEAQYNSKIWDCVGRFLSPPDIERFTGLATHTADLNASDLRSLMQLCRDAF
jgi:2-methylcitrate dehydratase PrpD